MAQWLTNPTRNHEVSGLIPSLAQWVKDHVLCPWHRPAAIAPIGPLAWEPPCAAGVAQEMVKRQNKQTKTNKQKKHNMIKWVLISEIYG